MQNIRNIRRLGLVIFKPVGGRDSEHVLLYFWGSGFEAGLGYVPGFFPVIYSKGVIEWTTVYIDIVKYMDIIYSEPSYINVAWD